MDLSKFQSDYTRSSEQERPVEMQLRDGQYIAERKGFISEAGTTGPSIGGTLDARRAGHPIPSADLQPTDTVKVGGVETSVEVALAMGYLTKDASGYRALNATEEAYRASAEKTAEDAKRSEAERERNEDEATNGKQSYMSERSEQRISVMLERAPGEATRVATEIVDNKGEVSEAALNAFASRLEMEPEKVAVLVEATRQDYRNEAVEMAHAQTKVDRAVLDEAFTWAAEAGVGRDEAHQHFMAGRANYSGVIDAYLQHTVEADPQRWIEAEVPSDRPGYSVSQTGDGQLAFHMPGGQSMSLAVAIKQRLVSIR